MRNSIKPTGVNISKNILFAMKVLIVQNHKAEDLGAFETYLRTHNVNYFVHNAYKNKTFPAITDWDAFIIGGTPISIYDPAKPQWLKEEISCLSKAVVVGKPYLGVCGGGQILASILGAKVKQNPVKEVGGYKANLTPDGEVSPFFKEFPAEFPVFQFHGDTFDVPKGAVLLVEGKDCKNQAFSHGKALSLQLHLEVSSKTAGKWAEEYEKWLGGFGKSKAQIMDECARTEGQMKVLADLLMENFLRVAKL
jgi:GMP synthase (glutamine-hydrolysing)